MENKYSVILTTCSNEDCLNKLIDSLLDNKLAACIQVVNIRSYYVWQNKKSTDKELLLLIKTKSDLFSKVEECIIKNHTYEIPEIIQLPIINGFTKYLNWIDEVAVS
ncbi:MAG: divalent-cation tolerance protein CutA [Elusimicrobiota bacterium]